jgi:hypothetical protein
VSSGVDIFIFYLKILKNNVLVVVKIIYTFIWIVKILINAERKSTDEAWKIS